MSVRLSCPSCNTAFALPALPADHRATCPRCGDVFPLRGEVIEEANRDREGAGEPVAPLFTKHETPNTKHQRGMWSVRRTAFVALAMGLLGLGIGLTVYYTRGGFRSKTEPSLVAAVPPMQLAALGYLPAECNVVFAVQPGPLLAYASRTKQDPNELFTRAGIPPQVLTSLEQLGLAITHIDHIAGGFYLPDGTEDFRIALVLVLKLPLGDEDEFLKNLKARKAPGMKPRYDVFLAGKVPLLLERVSPTVWVFGLNEKDLEAVARGGYGPGATQFRGTEESGLRKMIGAIPPDAAVWLAADDDRDWMQKPLVKLLSQSAEVKKWLPAASGGRGGLVALSFGEQPRMRLFVRTSDSTTGDKVRAYFAARATEMESATSGGGGTFALFDAPYNPATGWNTLQRFLSDATR